MQKSSTFQRGKRDIYYKDVGLAIKNALRYFPSEYHIELGKEFLYELQTYGHIYMYCLIPTYEMKAYPIDQYPAKTQ